MEEDLVDSYKKQIILASTFMIGVPFATFFYFRSTLTTLWITEPSAIKPFTLQETLGLERDVDTWAALAAVLAVQAVIFSIVLLKYKDDILDVFVRDRGDLEYGDDGTTINSKRHQKSKVVEKLNTISNGAENVEEVWQKKAKKSKNKKRHLH